VVPGTGSKVTVRDSTPPSLTFPADFFVEATSAAGIALRINASAQDAARPMPPHAVLKRLGPSELSVGGNDDLANALRIAYEALGSPPAS
jgi:hypothetical protein